MNYHNKPNTVGTFSDAQTVTKNTSTDSTNMVYIGGPTNGQLMLSIFANAAFTVEQDLVFSVKYEAYTSDTTASATYFGTYNNSGGIPQDEAADVLANGVMDNTFFKVTASGGAAAYAAGDMIYECAIPDNMLRLQSYDYIQLVYTSTNTSANPGAVDAFIWAKP